MNEPAALVEQHGVTLVVTLNRPHVRNAVDLEMALIVSDAMDQLDADPALRVGVITGAGRTFCSGMDLNEFSKGRRPVVPSRGFAGLVESPPTKPLIAAVEGAAIAGGFEIVLTCDLVTAGNSAFFALPEVKRGLIAAAGGLLRLPERFPRSIAAELALTGEPMSAEEAQIFGLVNRLVPDGQALIAALALAQLIAVNGPRAVRATKESLGLGRGRPHAEAFLLQAELAHHVRESDEAIEGARAYIEKRTPSWAPAALTHASSTKRGQMSVQRKPLTPTATQTLEAVFAGQSRQRWITARSTAAERKEALRALHAAVMRYADDAADALYGDLGKPRETPYMREVARVAAYLDDALEHLDEWMKPEPFPDRTAGIHSLVRYEAKGVCALFGPWNFPYQLTLAPLVPMLAAGNTAIVKPNELAPATSQLIARMLGSTFDSHHVAVVEGGVDTANRILELRLDHIFFTGSPAVGRIVMAAAAKRLIPVTLELGGKCPAIVDATANVARAASQIARGKHHNSGQVCLAPDHVWVSEDVQEEFVSYYLAWMRDHLYNGRQLRQDKCSKIVNQHNFDRIQGYVAEAVSRGATAHTLGGSHEDRLLMAPVALVDVPLDAAVMQEEIFGPVLPILPFRDRSDVISHLQRSPKPLAIYVFSEDNVSVEEFIASTSSGGVTVNGWATHFNDERLPFGGVGESGMGRYQGKAGFVELSNLRAVVHHDQLVYGGLLSDG